MWRAHYSAHPRISFSNGIRAKCVAREPKPRSKALGAHSPCRSREVELEILVSLHRLKALPSQWVPSSVEAPFLQFWAFSPPNHASGPLSIPSLKFLSFTKLVTLRGGDKINAQNCLTSAQTVCTQPCIKNVQRDWNASDQIFTGLGRGASSPRVFVARSWGAGVEAQKGPSPFQSSSDGFTG